MVERPCHRRPSLRICSSLSSIAVASLERECSLHCSAAARLIISRVSAAPSLSILDTTVRMASMSASNFSSVSTGPVMPVARPTIPLPTAMKVYKKKNHNKHESK
ncbi:hypothetical protein TcCL_NonESM05092 [Trypanosoma cruzi]|nr:hypothetical protein TcCL_NonESM05092 [Trypanosoma cruzi]